MSEKGSNSNAKQEIQATNKSAFLAEKTTTNIIHSDSGVSDSDNSYLSKPNISLRDTKSSTMHDVQSKEELKRDEDLSNLIHTKNSNNYLRDTKTSTMHDVQSKEELKVDDDLGNLLETKNSNHQNDVSNFHKGDESGRLVSTVKRAKPLEKFEREELPRCVKLNTTKEGTQEYSSHVPNQIDRKDKQLGRLNFKDKCVRNEDSRIQEKTNQTRKVYKWLLPPKVLGLFLFSSHWVL